MNRPPDRLRLWLDVVKIGGQVLVEFLDFIFAKDFTHVGHLNYTQALKLNISLKQMSRRILIWC